MRLLFWCLILSAAAALAQSPATAPKELASVSGRTMSNGQPLRKSTVTLRPIGLPPGVVVGGAVVGSVGSIGQMGAALQPYGTNTDADGRFSFDGVEPGTYLLMAEHPGYIRGSYSAKKVGPNTLVLASGQRMTEANIELSPQSTISGKVLDEDGEPAARAQVRVMKRLYVPGGRQQMQALGVSMSDENGEFKVTGLVPGKYLLSVTPGANGGMLMDTLRRAEGEKNRPEEGPATTYYPGTIDIAAAVPIDVAAGQDVAGMNMKLAKVPVFHIRGKASGALPTDTAGTTRVVVAPRSSSSMMMSIDKSSMIAKDGSFDVGGLPAGAYLLSLLRLGGQSQVLATASVDIGGQSIEGISLDAVAPSDLKGIVRVEGTPQTPPSGQTVGGTVLGGTIGGGASNRATNGAQAASGQSIPTPVFRVSLIAMEGMMLGGSMNTAAKPDGSFVIPNVGPGKFRVQVNSPPGAYVKSVKYSGRETLDTGLDLSQGAAGALEITVSYNAGEISGTVQDRDGKPLSGTVTLIPDGLPTRADLYKLAPVPDTGQFGMRGVAPGSYRIYSWAELDQGSLYDPDFMRLHENEGQRITVEENSKAQVALVR